MPYIKFIPLLLFHFALQAQTISVIPNRNICDKRGYTPSTLKWIKGKDIVIGNDSFCVVFFNLNVDSCFTSTKDKVVLTQYGTDSSDVNSYSGTRNIQPHLILGFNGKAYELNVDTSGCNPVTINARPDLSPPVQLQIGDQLPHFKFVLLNGDSVDVYSVIQPGKFTYIEFWGIWCAGCVQSIPKLKALNDSCSGRVVIISLDSYDNRNKVKDYVQKKGMTWTQGYSNSTIEKLLYVGDGFPYGVLVNEQGQIIGFDVTPFKLNKMFSE